MPIDLDKIIGRVTGQRTPQRKSRRQRVVDVLGLIARVAESPAPAGSVWGRVVAAEARTSDPRPSRMLRAFLDGLPDEALQQIVAEHNEILEY